MAPNTEIIPAQEIPRMLLRHIRLLGHLTGVFWPTTGLQVSKLPAWQRTIAASKKFTGMPHSGARPHYLQAYRLFDAKHILAYFVCRIKKLSCF
jgi:hypothetical protein